LLQKECFSVAGVYIRECLGMSEAAPITMHGENEPEGKRGSIGRAVPGLSISIRDVATKKEVPLGEDGRMWIRGPLVMKGYWGNPQATSDTIQNDWMDTGDCVRRDQDGYIWFCGRQKQIIVHDGSNISPIEVEDVLMTHEAVDQAGVVGVSDIVHGENVKAFITLKDSATANPPSEEELIQHCRLKIGYKAPASIEFLSSMPLNPTGKVDRAALKTKGDVPIMVQAIARKWMRNVLMRRASAEARRRSSMVEMEVVSPELLQLLQEEDYEGESNDE
jgi:long-chain acyl-CoA synthetase